MEVLLQQIITDKYMVLFFLFVCWLYGQVRMDLLESSRQHVVRMDKALEAYSLALVAIRRFLVTNEGLDCVEQALAKATPYLPIQATRNVVDWGISRDTTILQGLSSHVSSEIYRLKCEQVDTMARPNLGMLDSVEDYYNRYLKPFILAGCYTLANCLVFAFLAAAALVLQTHKGWSQVPAVLGFVTVFLVFILTLGSMDIFFRKGPRNWFLLVALVGYLLTLCLSLGYSYWPIFGTSLSLLYMFVVGSLARKRSNGHPKETPVHKQ